MIYSGAFSVRCYSRQPRVSKSSTNRGKQPNAHHESANLIVFFTFAPSPCSSSQEDRLDLHWHNTGWFWVSVSCQASHLHGVRIRHGTNNRAAATLKSPIHITVRVRSRALHVNRETPAVALAVSRQDFRRGERSAGWSCAHFHDKLCYWFPKGQIQMLKAWIEQPRPLLRHTAVTVRSLVQFQSSHLGFPLPLLPHHLLRQPRRCAMCHPPSLGRPRLPSTTFLLDRG